MQIQSGSFPLESILPTATTGGDSSTFYQVLFCEPFKTDRVVVFPFVQTFNGVHSPGLRIQDVNQNGFKIRFNEFVANVGGANVRGDGRHTTEKIGFIAMEENCQPKVLPPKKLG